MKTRSAFEERLISYASESTLKSAKQLLKNNLVKSAFRDSNQVLHAVFEEKNNLRQHTSLQLGEKIIAQCDCAAANDRSNEEALNVAIEILSPTRRFINVDFPTLGLPTIFTKPALCILSK